MKKNRKFNYSKTFKKQRILIAAVMGILLISMSVGYALYNEELKLEGEVVIEIPNGVMIYSLGVSDVGTTAVGDIVYRTTEGSDSLSLDSDLDFEFQAAEKDGLYSSYITYVYEIVNLGIDDYTYQEFMFNGDMSNNGTLRAPVIEGIKPGDVISSRNTKFVKVTYYYPNDLNSDVSVKVESSFVFKEGNIDVAEGSLRTSIDKTEAEVNDSNMADFNIDVMNLFDSSIIYEIRLSNSDVVLTNSSGTAKDYKDIINSGATNEHHVYLKVKDGVDLSNDLTTDIYVLTDSGERYTIGRLTLLGDSRPKYSNVVVDYTIEAAPSWANHYHVYFNITNNNTFTLDQYTIYIYLDDSINITEYHNYQSMAVYVPEENLIKISSANRWSSAHNSLAPGATYELSETVFGMNVSDLKFDKIVVYKDAETYTDGFSYQPNGY